MMPAPPNKKSMDRRSFLRLAGGSGAAIALSPLSAVALRGDWYLNDRLGFSLRKPPSWSFVSVTDFVRSQERQEPHLEDPALMAELRSMSDAPILVINRYRDDGDHFCPSIQVLAEPASSVDEEDWEAFCQEMTNVYRPYFPDFEVEAPATPFRLDGYPALEMRVTFSFNAYGHSYPTRLRSVLARTDAALLNFHFLAATHGPEECRDELQRCRDSISLGPRHHGSADPPDPSAPKWRPRPAEPRVR